MERKGWKERARALNDEVRALLLALRDPRTPWYARAVGALVVAYALSPIDLIPDFIPILGALDDLVLVPLGIGLTIRLIPREVLEECRARAASGGEKRSRWAGALVVALVWCGAAALAAAVIIRRR